MDPGMYARSYGVQSEANKVTVTRVAGNEIVYRRVVNTYRRSMASTVNGIKREQKKLRGHMRGYRRKLQGDNKQLPKPYKHGWIANTHPDDGLDYRKEYANSMNGRKSPEKTLMSELNEDPKSRKEKQTAAKVKDQRHYLQSKVDAFIKAPNITARKRVDEKGQSNKNSKGRRKDRRLFVLGSGKIQSSERVIKDVLEDGDEIYSLLSDSSDEERPRGDVKFETDLQNQMAKDRLKRFQSELIRSNSGAYFKVIDMSSGNPKSKTCIEGDQIGPNEIETNKLQTGENHYDICIPSGGEEECDSDTILERDEDQDKEFSNNKIVLPQIIPLNYLDSLEETNVSGGQSLFGDNVHTYKHKTKENHKKGISFGDIAKLQHGIKTKKLFSLVDELASRHGITSEVVHTSNSNTKNTKLPVAPKRINFNKTPTQKDSRGLSSGLPSVFYAMQFGYESNSANDDPTEKDLVEPAKNKVNSSRLQKPSQQQLKTTKDRVPSYRSATESNAESDGTNTLSTRLVQVELDDKLGELHDVDSRRSPFKKDTSPSFETKAGKSPPPLFRKDTSSISPDLSSLDRMARRSVGQEDVERSLQDVQSMMRHRGSRYQRQLRRDSMMEASEFVNSLRNRKSNRKSSFSTEMGSFDRRRESIVHDREAKPDMHKVEWSSALSQIKLIHTLADLTHLI